MKRKLGCSWVAGKCKGTGAGENWRRPSFQARPGAQSYLSNKAKSRSRFVEGGRLARGRAAVPAVTGSPGWTVFYPFLPKARFRASTKPSY